LQAIYLIAPMKKLLYTLFFLLIFSIAKPQVQQKIDSLEAILPSMQAEARSEVLLMLSGLYQSVSLEKSLEYDFENVEIQKNLGRIKDLSGIFNNIGVTYYLMGDYGKSLDYFGQSLTLREQFYDTANIVKTLNNLGVISQISGDFQKALAYFNKSLMFKIKLNDTLSIAKTLNNIGVLYKDVDEFDDAERFISQALDYYKALDNQAGIAAALNNLGQVFDERKSIDTAMIYYFQSLEIKRQLHDDRGIANTLNNLGGNSMAKGMYGEAEDYFIEAVKIRKTIGDNFGLASSLNNMGSLYFKKGKYGEAEKMFLESNTIAESEHLIGIEQRNFDGMSKLYEAKGEVVKALHYHKEYSKYRDSTFHIDLQDRIAALKVQYESEKSKRENTVLRQENEIQELKISNAQKERAQFITIIIFLFFASVLVILFLQYRNHRKLNSQLKQHNHELEIRVKERTHELEEANATKDRFFSIIAHDLKSPFNGLLGFADLLYNDFDELSDQEKKQFLGIIKNSAINIYKLLENLLQWASSQTGRISLNPEKLDLGLLITNIIEGNNLVYSKKRIETQIGIKSAKFAFADEETINTVLRNLFSNAIKFTPNDGKIEFFVDDHHSESGKNEIIVRVKDSGVGIKKEDIINLFDLKKKIRTAGTEKEIGTGLGLILCKEFVEKNGGQLFVESEPGKGSVFSFTLPCG